jgi:arylsulfatase
MRQAGALTLAASFLLGCGQTTTTKPAGPSSRPNVVLIVLDDVGFADLGSYGSEIRTPHLDGLAREGLRYNRFDTKAICSPTRASLITGRNSHAVGMGDIPDVAPETATPEEAEANRSFLGVMPLDAETVAEALKREGYRTVALGKWHLAPGDEDGSEGKRAHWPLQRGFDSYYGFISGHTPQWHPDLVEGNAPLPKPDRPGVHLSVDLTDRAIAAFEEQRTGSASDPVFLFLAYGFAHSPHHAPAEYRDRYRGVYAKGWDALREERLARMKEMGIVPKDTVLTERNPGDPSWESLTEQQKKVYARFMENYAGFLEHGDEQVGRLIAHLKSTGQYENTLFVVLSDNGAAPEAGQAGSFREVYFDKTTLDEMEESLDELGGPETEPHYQRPWAMAGNTPFRRYKTWPFAGGSRDPLIITWPGVIQDAGAIRTQFVDVIDIAPTIADAAGARFGSEVDGRSIRATFTSASAPTRDVQFFELRANRAITSGNWKAVAMHEPGSDFEQDQWLLFDVSKDFSEATDVAAENPEKLAELKSLWMAEAAKYSKPPLKEMSELLVKLGLFDDAFSVPEGEKPR